MKIFFKYGTRNDPKKPHQKVYLIFRRNNKLEFRKSLDIIVKKQHWDFKNKNIVSKTSKIPFEEREELYKKIDLLDTIVKVFNRRFSELEMSTMGFRSTTKEEFIYYCENTLEEAFNPIKEKVLNPLLLDLMIEYRDYYKNLKSETYRHSESTTRIWNRQLVMLERFQKAIGKEFRINEITIKDFYNAFHSWCDKGVTKAYKNDSTAKYYKRTQSIVFYSEATRSTFIKKVKATLKRADESGEYPDMCMDFKLKLFEAKMQKKESDTLTSEEIDKLFNYTPANKKESNLLNLVKLQYELCLRYSDIIANLGDLNPEYKKGRFHKAPEYILKPLEAIKSKIDIGTTLEGSKVYRFSCIQPKINRVNSSKIVPISDEIKELLLDSYNTLELWSNAKYNREIKKLLEALKIDKEITSHCLRKSKCTNLYNAGVPTSEIIKYSGHFSEDELKNTYINWELANFKGKYNPNTRGIE